MKFFLGTHHPHWLADARFADVPLFVSHAPGPDAWAWDEAARRHVTVGPVALVRYVTRGENAGWTVDSTGKRVRRWAMDDPPWLLSRNAAMVREVTAMAPREQRACLALLDTRGTEQTVGLARAAGLAVRVETWTGAMTPGGG